MRRYKSNKRIKQDSFSFSYEQHNKSLTNKNKVYSIDVPYSIYESTHYCVRLSLDRQRIKSHKEQKRFVLVADLPISVKESLTYLRAFRSLKFKSVTNRGIRAVNYIEKTTETETTYWSDGEKTEYSTSYETPKTDYVTYITGWTLYRSFTSREHLDSFIDALPDLFKSDFAKKIKTSSLRRLLSNLTVTLSSLIKNTFGYILIGVIGLANLYIVYQVIFVWLIMQSYAPLTDLGMAVFSSIIGVDILAFLGWYLLKHNEIQLHRLTENIRFNIFDLKEIPIKILSKI